MFSHGAVVAPVAGVMVAPEAPILPGVHGRAQPGKQGRDTLAHAGKPGEHERVVTNTESRLPTPGWSTGMQFTPVHRPMSILEMPGEHQAAVLSAWPQISVP